MGHDFSFSEKFGYLSPNVENIGSSLKASIQIGLTMESLEICQNYIDHFLNLPIIASPIQEMKQVIQISSDRLNVYEISNL